MTAGGKAENNGVPWSITAAIWPCRSKHIHAREILKTRQQLNELLASHTGQDVDTIAQDTDRDNFMDPQQALDYGLVDKVFANRGIDSKD